MCPDMAYFKIRYGMVTFAFVGVVLLVVIATSALRGQSQMTLVERIRSNPIELLESKIKELQKELARVKKAEQANCVHERMEAQYDGTDTKTSKNRSTAAHPYHPTHTYNRTSKSSKTTMPKIKNEPSARPSGRWS
jgi:hypothetical protein